MSNYGLALSDHSYRQQLPLTDVAPIDRSTTPQPKRLQARAKKQRRAA